jgi:hypothetical protein
MLQIPLDHLHARALIPTSDKNQAGSNERRANLKEDCEMVRKLAIVAGLAVMLAGVANAQSKCDSAISKAIGKKVSCECGAYSKVQKKGGSPDFSKCTSKFSAACTKAKGGTDCTIFAASTCAGKEAAADTDSANLCNHSPSGAFLQ